MSIKPSTSLVPTRFVWPHGGLTVFLCGSFNRYFSFHSFSSSVFYLLLAFSSLFLSFHFEVGFSAKRCFSLLFDLVFTLVCRDYCKRFKVKQVANMFENSLPQLATVKVAILIVSLALEPFDLDFAGIVVSNLRLNRGRSSRALEKHV